MDIWKFYDYSLRAAVLTILVNSFLLLPIVKLPVTMFNTVLFVLSLVLLIFTVVFFTISLALQDTSSKKEEDRLFEGKPGFPFASTEYHHVTRRGIVSFAVTMFFGVILLGVELFVIVSRIT